MSDHTRTLIPIGTGAYSSPDLLDVGKQIDVGLLAESLLYYESIVIDVTAAQQLEDLLTWFDRQAKAPDLIALIRDGTLTFSGYDFLVQPFNTFVARRQTKRVTAAMTVDQERKSICYAYDYIMSSAVNTIISNEQYVKDLQSAISHSFSVKTASDYNSANNHAMIDYNDPKRFVLVLQAFVDKLYDIRNLRDPPRVDPVFGPVVQGMIDVGRMGPSRHVELGKAIESLVPSRRPSSPRPRRGAIPQPVQARDGGCLRAALC